MVLNRRNFLKTITAVAGFSLLQPVKAAGIAKAASSISDMAMLVDVSKCIGCWKCYYACKEHNNLPEIIPLNPDNPPELAPDCWCTLLPVKKGNAWRFRKQACMHCTDASCEQVCPTGAISHQGAVVIIDQEWCVGCGYCVQACPFGVPHKDEHTGTARKCTFCIDLISNGQNPACVDVCPTGAIQYGQRAELIASTNTQVETLKIDGYPEANLYGANEHQPGGLGVMYVLNDKPTVYGLPEAPRLVTSNVVSNWLSGIITFAVAAVLPLWLLFRRKMKNQTNDRTPRKEAVK